MRSLWLKITLSFVVLIILVTVLMAFFTNMAVRGRFKAYLLTTYRAQAQLIAPVLAEYYYANGGWEGVDGFVKELASVRPLRRGLGMIMRQPRIIVADEEGTIVADSAGEVTGRKLSPADLSLSLIHI